MSTGTDQEYAQTIVKGIVIGNYINFAILTVLLYDTIAYFEEEIKYFWAKPRSVVSISYFMIRYGSIFNTATGLLTGIPNANETMCRIIYAQDILHILFLRVRALYSQGRMITRLLIIMFRLEALASIAFVIHQSILLNPIVLEFEGISVCAGNGLPLAEDIATWCIPLAYGTLLMVLALYKARQFWTESAGIKGLNLVKVLIRDQAFYFLSINVVCIAELLEIPAQQSFFWTFALSPVGSPALLSIIGSRLLLNMKVAGEKGLNQGISHSLHSISSNIDFAAPPDGAAETSLGNTAESLEAEIQDTA